jgi:hypothetical protein
MFTHLFQNYIEYTIWTQLQLLDGIDHKMFAWAVVGYAGTN